MIRFYSYHWQDSNDNLIIRWDNSPHHLKIKTFPHHKHIKNKITESDEITINELIGYISKNISFKL
jgi:hypothetical protein